MAARLNFITPFFIVSNLLESVSFYVEKLGFKVWYILPEQEPFFAMIGRDGASLMLKAITVDVAPLPNSARHTWASWDAFINTSEPDHLFAEYQSGGVTFRSQINDTDDGLRGFEIMDIDGYVLFFGQPNHD